MPQRLRVLVVDDEPLMGSAIARVLEAHDVVALTSGRVALTRVAAGERFDVILCDVMMPEFSGIELYRGFQRYAPELLERLVFITGGAYTAESIEFLGMVPNAQLEKPIWPQALQGAVADVLRKSSSAATKGPARSPGVVPEVSVRGHADGPSENGGQNAGGNGGGDSLPAWLTSSR